MNRGYVVCLEAYCSILLLSYSTSSGALEIPDLLLSCSLIIIILHNTIILIITLTYHKSLSINQLINAGSVLVFLPGVPEINKFVTLLSKAWGDIGGRTDDGKGGGGGGGGKLKTLRIMPLHGGLPPKDQKSIFIDARPNELKIVAATNVAEASITIPDVSAVIDSCRVKETDFEPERQMNALVMKFASKDSLRQRRGRAGRVAAGRCFRCVTHHTYNNLPNHSVPEILRAAVDGLILQIKAMNDITPNAEKLTCAQQLSRCPDPPAVEVITASETVLTRMQALDSEGSITPLGRHLSALPCSPKVGRLLIYGCLLSCVYPMSLVAALLTSRSPFMNSFDQEGRDRLNQIRDKFAAQAVGGAAIKSDQMIIIAIFKEFEKHQGQANQRRFCRDHMLSFDRMFEIQKLSKDFGGDLANLGLISNVRDPRANSNSNRPRVVSAAICAGLYPQVARILRPPKRFEDVMGNALEKET